MRATTTIIKVTKPHHHQASWEEHLKLPADRGVLTALTDTGMIEPCERCTNDSSEGEVYHIKAPYDVASVLYAIEELRQDGLEGFRAQQRPDRFGWEVAPLDLAETKDDEAFQTVLYVDREEFNSSVVGAQLWGLYYNGECKGIFGNGISFEGLRKITRALNGKHVYL